MMVSRSHLAIVQSAAVTIIRVFATTEVLIFVRHNVAMVYGIAMTVLTRKDVLHQVGTQKKQHRSELNVNDQDPENME